MLIFVVLLTNTAVTYASNDSIHSNGTNEKAEEPILYEINEIAIEEDIDEDIEDDCDKTSIIISGDFIDNYNTVDHESPGEIAIKSISEISHEDLINAFNDESLASSEIISSFDSELLDLFSMKKSGICPMLNMGRITSNSLLIRSTQSKKSQKATIPFCANTFGMGFLTLLFRLLLLT